jgi:hypothetical protein
MRDRPNRQPTPNFIEDTMAQVASTILPERRQALTPNQAPPLD